MMIVFIEIHVIIVKKRKVNAHYGHSTHEKNKGSMSILFFFASYAFFVILHDSKHTMNQVNT